MDKGAMKHGADHRWLDPKHDPENVRDWTDDWAARRLKKGLEWTDGHKRSATGYVRVAYGHICLDEVVSEEKDRVEAETGERPEDKDFSAEYWDRLYAAALVLFLANGYERTFHKRSERAL
jgi:hypothetical protein